MVLKPPLLPVPCTAHFAQTTCLGDQGSCIGIISQVLLEGRVLLIAKQSFDVFGKDWGSIKVMG
jgi:hypothetical protein